MMSFDLTPRLAPFAAKYIHSVSLFHTKGVVVKRKQLFIVGTETERWRKYSDTYPIVGVYSRKSEYDDILDDIMEALREHG